jgi:hypothetical protein
MLCAILVNSNASTAQPALNCGGVILPEPDNGLLQTCQSLNPNHAYYNQSLHVPYADGSVLLLPGANGTARTAATKTIRVSVHIWQDANGGGNYEDTPANRGSIINTLVHISNDHFTSPTLPSDPTEPLFTYLTAGRSAIQLTGIYFDADQAMYELTCDDGALLSVQAEALHPETKNSIKLHMVRPQCCIVTVIDPNTGQPVQAEAGGKATAPHYASGVSTMSQEVVTCGTGQTSITTQFAAFYYNHWSHELGHCLDLLHTYDGSELNNNQNLLTDVFWCGQQASWCPAVSCSQPYNWCPFSGNANCDPYASDLDNCHNNLMSNNHDNRSVTNLQLGRMHRSLSFSSAARFADGYNPIPFAPNNDPTIDVGMKLYQDLVIGANRTVTVKCRLEMVPQARIVIKPGGRLIVDGGTITTAAGYDQQWRGIVIESAGGPQTTNNNPPFFDNAGFLEIKNEGRIEHAQLGALVQGGAVIQVNGTPALFGGGFYNCGRAVDFEPFTNAANLSRFDFAEFQVDQDYMGQQALSDPRSQVRLTKVFTIPFRACKFSDLRTGITESHRLARGIEAFDSKFTVAACPNAALDCPPVQQFPCVFRGLDHGIHATQGVGGCAFTAFGAEFDNNVCGIYARGLQSFAVQRCSFEVGGSEATELSGNLDQFYWEGRHRGIFATSSHGFVIRENALTALSGGAPSEGIVVGYNHDWNDAVLLNTASGFERAYVGEGISASLNGDYVWTIGLQFLCNENAGNATNLFSRKANGATASEQFFHTIRSYQGTPALPSDNTFDNEPIGPPAYWDVEANTTYTGIKFTTRTGLGYTPVNNADIVSWFVPPGNLPGLCAQQGLGPGAWLAPQDLENAVQAHKLAYANSRYLYQQLIDGGSTDEVVTEITDAWPQDYLELRAYLLSKSPYLSIEALTEAMEKTGFPDAIRAEVCIANPEATQKDGFLKWLEFDCSQPLPAYLINSIKESWDIKTFRTDLEAGIAGHHAAMSWATANLVVWHTFNGTATAMRTAWQEVRTPAARYAEALLLMQEERYAEASALITAMPVEHELKTYSAAERVRMLAYIQLLADAKADNRTASELTTAEVELLSQLADDASDRPATWMNNLLCRYYELCSAPFTGGGGSSTPKRQRPPALVNEAPGSTVALRPNPAHAWVAVDHALAEAPVRASLAITDALGRTRDTRAISTQHGQTVIDLGGYEPGVYAVQLINAGSVKHSTKLVVQ